MIQTILTGYAVFSAIWFILVLAFFLLRKFAYPSIIKIRRAELRAKQEVLRNFGYGFIFSGGLSVVFTSIILLLTQEVSLLSVAVIFAMAIFSVIIGLRLLAASI